MFAKDSVLDLASLARSKSSLSDDSDEPHEVGESSMVSLASSGESDKDLTSIDKQGTDATSAATSVADSERSNGLGKESSKTDGGKSSISSKSTYGQYSAFGPDYYGEYENASMTYDVDPYAPTVFGARSGEENNFFCCLFAPWWSKKMIVDDDDDDTSSGLGDDEKGSLRKSLSREEDELSTGSDKYGEKLTDKDRLAVIARLRLSQPDPDPAAEPSSASSSHHGKGLLDEIPSCDSDTSLPKDEGVKSESKADTDSQSGKVRGILKRRSSSMKNKVPEAPSPRSTVSPSEHSTRRRSLFPTLEERTPNSSGHHVRFSPMARVVAIKSRNDMTFLEKSWIWYQKSDYDGFKKAGRIIAKAILEGGSEVWLTPKQSLFSTTQKQRSRSTGTAAPLPRSYHLTGRNPDLRSHESGQQLSSDEYGDKWWCSFGHSRRGLEHIASMDEGRERQVTVRSAIRAVLEDQRKQRRQNKVDPEKLRRVSLHYTTWARDLSLAAGAADAEAVKTEFSKDAKTRQFYLLKQAKVGSGAGRRVPSFMMPSGVTPLVLDANVSSQIRPRRRQVAPEPAPAKKEPPIKTEITEAIHDPVEQRENIAKKAAGFGTETDMAAVLSGMGAVAPQATTVGAH